MPKTDQQALLDAYMRNYAKAQAQTVSGGAGQMTSARQVGQAAMNAAKTDLPDYSGAVGGFASAYAKQVEANRKAAEKAAKQAAKEAEKAAKEAAEKQEQEQETEEKQLAGLDAYRASKAKLGGQDSGEQTPGVLKRLGAGVGAGVTGLAAGTANLADTARRTVQQRAQSMDNEAFALAVSTRDEMDAELARLLDSGLAFEPDGVTPTEAYRAALLTRDAAVEMMQASEADAPERAQAVQGLLDVSGGLSDTALTGLNGLPRLLGETGISIAQNLPALGLGLINPALGLGAMAASAAGSRAAELEAEGKGLGEALGRGLVSGGIEMLTEKLPMDSLLDMVKGGGKGAVRQILQQAATEGGEESVAYLANLLADAAAGDEVQFSLEELARSAAGGALSGGIMGGVGTLAGRVLNPEGGAKAAETAQNRQAGSLSALAETAPEGGNAAEIRGAVPAAEQQAAELAEVPQGEQPQGVVQTVPQAEQTAEPQTVPGLVQAVPGSEADQAAEPVQTLGQWLFGDEDAATGEPDAERDGAVYTLSKQAQAITGRGANAQDTIRVRKFLERLPEMSWEEAQAEAEKIAEEIVHEEDFYEVDPGQYENAPVPIQRALFDKQPIVVSEDDMEALHARFGEKDKRGRRLTPQQMGRKLGLKLVKSAPGVNGDDPSALWMTYDGVPIDLPDGVGSDYMGQFADLLVKWRENGGGGLVDTQAYEYAKRKAYADLLGLPEPGFEEYGGAQYDNAEQAGVPDEMTAEEIAAYSAEFAPQGTDPMLEEQRAAAEDSLRARLNGTIPNLAEMMNEPVLPVVQRAAEQSVSGGDGLPPESIGAMRSDPTSYSAMQNGYDEMLAARDAALEQARQAPGAEGQTPVLRRGGQSIPERMAQGGDSITEKAPPWRQEQGGQAVPDPDIPEGLKERGYAESIRRKSDLPDEIKQEFYSTPEVYEQLSNAETVRRAKAVLDKGLEPALVEYRAMLDAKDPAAVPLGYDLSKQLMQQERRDEAVELLRGMSEKLTESGQFSQAAAITLMKEDPMTALRYLQKQVDAMNREGREALKKKWTDFKLTDDEVKRFDEVQPGDQEGIRAIFEDVGKRLAKEYPVKFAEQAVEAMHVSMLLNPRTQNRNIQGNVAMLPMAAGARKTSALLQAAYRMKDKDFQPTQALVVSKQAKQLAAQTWDKVKDSIEGVDSDRWRNVTGTARDEREVFKTSKYIPFLKPGGQAAERVRDAANAVSQRMVGKTVFDAMSGDMSALENLRRFTYGLLELGDAGFVKKNFTDRMASYLAARGITSLEDVPDEAYVLARNEALKATFKDDNTYTKLLHDLKADLGPVGEMLFPFTKTPANVTARAVDFSPLGLAHTLSEVKKSGGDPGRVIDSLAKNLTGTTVIALGALLAKSRLMTGPEDENARKAAFDRQQGKLPWAIKVGDDYFTIDWAQPAATPLVLGAAMWYAAERNDSDVLLSALAAFGDTLLEQSSLQSFSDVFGGYGSSPTENLLNIAAEVPLRMIPAAAGATARVVDPVQRVTYSGEGMLDTLKNQAVSKIPYLSKTLPAAYDTWGNPVMRSGEGAEAVLAQYVNPGQLGNAAVTPLDGEIQRLYEATGDDRVFPRKAEWSVKLGDETRKLTAEEYSEMQRVMGETSYEAAAGVMETDSFRALDAQGQVDTLNGLYLAAKDAALTELFGDEYSVPDSRAKQARILAQYGVPGLVAWTDYKLGADADGNGSLTQEEARPWLLGSDLTPLQREYFWQLTNAQWKSGLYD